MRNAAAPAALVLVSGLVASGKSTLSRAVAERLGAERFEADRVRGTLLAAVTPESSGAETRWRLDLSAHFEDEIYADLLRRADETLAGGGSLVLDACFPRRAQRRAARELAARHGVPFLFVECRTSDATLRARLAERDRAAERPVWEAIHRQLAAHYEAPVEIPAAERLVVQCEGPTNPLVDAICERLRAVPAPEETGRTVHLAGRFRPQVVSFDCWNTLLVEEDWVWAHGLRVLALQDAARTAGRDVSREAAERAFDIAWRRHMDLWEELRVTTATEVATWALAELGLGDDPHALERLVHRFAEASHTSRVVALAGAPELLAALEAAGIACVLVCDTGLTPGRVVRRLLERVGLLKHLSALAFSDEVGAPKPAARPFLAALEPLGISPDQALHVGDLRRTDVAGARALGMRTARLRSPHDDTTELPDADHVVASHAELAGLLGLSLAGAEGERSD